MYHVPLLGLENLYPYNPPILSLSLIDLESSFFIYKLLIHMMHTQFSS